MFDVDLLMLCPAYRNTKLYTCKIILKEVDLFYSSSDHIKNIFEKGRVFVRGIMENTRPPNNDDESNKSIINHQSINSINAINQSMQSIKKNHIE